MKDPCYKIKVNCRGEMGTAYNYKEVTVCASNPTKAIKLALDKAEAKGGACAVRHNIEITKVTTLRKR